jgi:hypothetical protein
MDSKWIAWRMSFLAAFILSMMVNINYGASLVSSLLSTPVKTIRTTRDLIDSSLQFAAEDISYSVPYFAVSYNSLFPHTFSLIIESSSLDTMTDSVLKPVPNFKSISSYAYIWRYLFFIKAMNASYLKTPPSPPSGKHSSICFKNTFCPHSSQTLLPKYLQLHVRPTLNSTCNYLTDLMFYQSKVM